MTFLPARRANGCDASSQWRSSTFAKGERMRSIVTAMVVGGLCTVACKKSDNAAKEEKVQEAPAPTPASHKEPAPAAKTAAPGVAAGGIQHDDNKEGPAAILTQAKGSVEVRRLGET